MFTVVLTSKTDCCFELVKTESRERFRSKMPKVTKMYRRSPKNAENEAGTSRVLPKRLKTPDMSRIEC